MECEACTHKANWHTYQVSKQSQSFFNFLRLIICVIRGDHYLEMDVNIHRWGNIARQAIGILFSRFGQMVNSIGFCIESVEDEEMPENLFGCGKVIKVDPVNTVRWEDLN